MYLVDLIEHGNCGVSGTKVLAEGTLFDLKMLDPHSLGISEKMWGFYPVISWDEKGTDRIYAWDELLYIFVPYRFVNPSVVEWVYPTVVEWVYPTVGLVKFGSKYQIVQKYGHKIFPWGDRTMRRRIALDAIQKNS